MKLSTTEKEIARTFGTSPKAALALKALSNRQLAGDDEDTVDWAAWRATTRAMAARAGLDEDAWRKSASKALAEMGLSDDEADAVLNGDDVDLDIGEDDDECEGGPDTDDATTSRGRVELSRGCAVGPARELIGSPREAA